MKDIRLGISPCPNDTFIFYHLLEKGNLPFKITPVVRDVEELNRRVLDDSLDVSKVSFAVAGRVLDRYIILSAGGALGRGCGPLILARGHMSREKLARSRIAIPGKNTTAALLLRLYIPEAQKLTEMPFSEIVEAICSRKVDAGCVIHETRFIYKDFGLVMIQDLGSWWEQITGMPIPLGGIIARRSLQHDQLLILQESIRQSIKFARENYDEVSKFIAQYAQELSPDVQRKHIALYVNHYSYDLGEEGREAVRVFFKRAASACLIPPHPHENRMFFK